MVTYHSLHHQHSLFPESVDNPGNVHHTLLLSLLQSNVNGDEGASTTHTSTAVHYDGWTPSLPASHNLLVYHHERATILWDTMIRP